MINLKQIDVIIKSFNRPAEILRLVKSWNLYYPQISLTICDDSTQQMDFSDPAYYNHKIIYLPEKDMGISYGRNYGIKHTDKDYILFLDDDFIMHENTKIETLLRLFEIEEDIGIVGGVMGERSKHTVTQGGELSLKNGICAKKCLEDQLEVFDKINYRYCSMTDNFFIANRKVFEDVLWDSTLKVCEHTDFFLQVKNANWKVIFTPDVLVGHLHETSNKIYDKFRYERYHYFKELFWAKYGIIEEVYLNADDTLQKKWITSSVRIDFDRQGNIKPYSSKLKGFILCECIGVQNGQLIAQIVAIDVLDKIHLVGDKIYLHDDDLQNVVISDKYYDKKIVLLSTSDLLV